MSQSKNTFSLTPLQEGHIIEQKYGKLYCISEIRISRYTYVIEVFILAAIPGSEYNTPIRGCFDIEKLKEVEVIYIDTFEESFGLKIHLDISKDPILAYASLEFDSYDLRQVPL